MSLEIDLKDAKLGVECALYSDIPCMLWGEPGVGKSSIIHLISEEQDVEMRDIRLSQYESVDLRGLPSTENSTTVWNVPDFLPKDPDSSGIIFLDELPQGDPSVQAVAYQLVLDRMIGTYVVPPGWRIVAAGNPGTDPMRQALANRFTHLYVRPDIKNWSVWAKSEGLSSDVIGFLNSRPDLLSQKPTNQHVHAFPSPRTWADVAKVYTDHGQTTEVWKDLAKGSVSEGPIIELNAYINLLSKLPDIDQLAAAPHSYDFSDSPSKQAAMAMLIVDGMTVKNVGPLMEYVNTITQDFQMLIITLINETNNKLMGTRPITDWCIANPDIL